LRREDNLGSARLTKNDDLGVLLEKREIGCERRGRGLLTEGG
jgi:hypothetical protein